MWDMSQEKNDSIFFVLGKPMQCCHSNPNKLTSVCLEIIKNSAQFKTWLVLMHFFLLDEATCYHHILLFLYVHLP